MTRQTVQYPDPDLILSGELGDWLRVLEDERRVAQRKGLKRLALTIPIISGVLLFSLVANDANWLKQIFAALGALGLAYAWAQAPARAIMPAVKTEINTEIARAMKLEYQAYPDANFAFDCGQYFGLLPWHDQAKFEDLWRGQFDGRDFELIEVHLLKKDKRSNRRRMRSVFRGTLLSIRTRVCFESATLIRERNALRDWNETYALDGTASPIELGMERFETGNPDFDARFECHSENPAEGMCLATAQVRHEISRIRSMFPGGRHTSAVFHDGHFVMIVGSGNMFESGQHFGNTDYEMVTATIRQFAQIADAASSV